jgi:hypothetical protein
MVWSKLATAATAFGQTVVGSGPQPDRLTCTWQAVQERLPDGWRLEAIRYATDGWAAQAVNTDGEVRSHQAEDAVSALEGLAATFAR